RQYDLVFNQDPLFRGKTLETWIPQIKTNLDYPFNYQPPDEKAQRTITIHISSKWSETNWAGDWTSRDWAALIKALQKTFIVRVIGLAFDDVKFQEVQSYGVDVPQKVGQQTFKEVLDTIMSSAMYVGNVSGLTFLSAWMGQKTIALWPGNNARQKLPRQMWNIGIRKDHLPTYKPLTYEESVQTVLKEIAALYRS
ncbi:MAG: hypothetical protein SVY53_08550, partial [Chloroflexota bacterium]|nr:hypothetical protein [Chloroflexota bacterium]